jgi:hypothetical protein
MAILVILLQINRSQQWVFASKMTPIVPPTLSVLVSVWIETLFYGINVVVYFICLYVFLSKRTAPTKNNAQLILLVMSTLLFAAATAHVSVNLRRLIEGYVLPHTKAAMTKYLLDISQPDNVAKECLLAVVSFLSGIILVRSKPFWDLCAANEACHITGMASLRCMGMRLAYSNYSPFSLHLRATYVPPLEMFSGAC